MITVYYDGKCGLCSREIRYYMRLAPAEVFNWCDIARYPEHLEKIGVSQHQALKILHVIDSDGQIYQGVDGFLQIWRHFDYWRVLAMIVSLPVVRSITDLVYRLFAHYRFKRSTRCQLSLENDDSPLRHRHNNDT